MNLTITESLLAVTRPKLIIRSGGRRFTSCVHVNQSGDVSTSLPLNSRIYSDYRQWINDSKGKCEKSYKIITLNDNLLYVIE